jgi:hypothetical protein
MCESVLTCAGWHLRLDTRSALCSAFSPWIRPNQHGHPEGHGLTKSRILGPWLLPLLLLLCSLLLLFRFLFPDFPC